MLMGSVLCSGKPQARRKRSSGRAAASAASAAAAPAADPQSHLVMRRQRQWSQDTRHAQALAVLTDLARHVNLSKPFGFLGAGSFGAVFTAKLLPPGARASSTGAAASAALTVAMKLIAPHVRVSLTPSGGAHVNMLPQPSVLRELRAMAAIAGGDDRAAARHVALPVGSGYLLTRTGFIGFPMPLLAGSLRDLCNACPVLPVSGVQALFSRVVQGVLAGARVGLCHRDVKPDNVFVGTDEHGNLAAVVGDWGMSTPAARMSYGAGQRQLATAATEVDGGASRPPGKRRRASEPQHWHATADVISTWYAPPEVLDGSGRYTQAADVWSLGVMLAELLSSGSLIFDIHVPRHEFLHKAIVPALGSADLSRESRAARLKLRVLRKRPTDDVPADVWLLLADMLNHDATGRIELEALGRHPFVATAADAGADVARIVEALQAMAAQRPAQPAAAPPGAIPPLQLSPVRMALPCRRKAPMVELQLGNAPATLARLPPIGWNSAWVSAAQLEYEVLPLWRPVLTRYRAQEAWFTAAKASHALTAADAEAVGGAKQLAHACLVLSAITDRLGMDVCSLPVNSAHPPALAVVLHRLCGAMPLPPQWVFELSCPQAMEVAARVVCHGSRFAHLRGDRNCRLFAAACNVHCGASASADADPDAGEADAAATLAMARTIDVVLSTAAAVDAETSPVVVWI